MMFRFLTDGVEYAIILPTLWDYLKTKNCEVSYIGIVLGVYAIGGLISAPLAGYISDKLADKISTGILLSVGCCLSVVGNFIYFIAPTKEFIALGRFIAGFGVDPIVLAEIGRQEFLTNQQKQNHISGIHCLRQLGLLLGPTIVIFLDQVKSKTYFRHGFFEIHVDKYNSAGLVTSLFYLTSACSFIFLYRTDQIRDYLSQQSSSKLETHRSKKLMADATSTDIPSEVTFQDKRDEAITSTVTKCTDLELSTNHSVQENSLFLSPASYCQTRVMYPQKLASKKIPKAPVSQILLYEPMIISFFGTYISFFMQSTIESCMMPLLEKYFQFNQVAVSKIFIAIGVLGFVGYMSTSLNITHKITQGTKGINLVGGLGNFISTVCLYFYCSFITPKYTSWKIPIFYLLLFIYVFSLPYMIVGTSALTAAATPKYKQGSMQSLRTASQNLGLILGPIFSTYIYRL